MACGAFSFARREGGGVAGKAWGILYILGVFGLSGYAHSTLTSTPTLFFCKQNERALWRGDVIILRFLRYKKNAPTVFGRSVDTISDLK